MAIVTIAEVTEFMGVASSAKLVQLTDSYNTLAESYCGRDFDMTYYEEAIRINPYQTDINLAQCPLATLVSLVDTSDEEVDTDAIDYEAGVLIIDAGYWNAFPTLETSREWLTVEYWAGYDNKPEDLKLAVLSMIESRYNTSDSAIISERLMDRSYRKNDSGFPTQAESILNLYRISV